MLRYYIVTINSQTHACGLGYAVGDNVESETYTFAPTPEQEQELNTLLEQIEQKFQADNLKRCELWSENNPAETECVGDGEEFIGLTWVESSQLRVARHYPDDDDTESVLVRLRYINNNYEAYCKTV